MEKDFYCIMEEFLAGREKYLKADPDNLFYQGEVHATRNLMTIYLNLEELKKREKQTNE